MIIAKQNEDSTFTLNDYREMFPTTSFTDRGPNDEWFTENNCYRVSGYKEYDSQTQRLTPCDPYLENGTVFTVTVENI